MSFYFNAVWILKIYCATTERTSGSILLNSSKQHHEPVLANPLKNLNIAIEFNPSEALKTIHYIPAILDKSFVVSVLPVPAGPSGAPP